MKSEVEKKPFFPGHQCVSQKHIVPTKLYSIWTVLECLSTSVGLTDGLLPVLQHSQTMSSKEVARSSRGTSLTAARGLVFPSHSSTTYHRPAGPRQESHAASCQTLMQRRQRRTQTSEESGGGLLSIQLFRFQCSTGAKNPLLLRRCLHFSPKDASNS